MKKKLVLMAGVLLIGLSACGGSTENEKVTTSNENNQEDVKDKEATSNKEYTIKINGVEHDFPMTYQEFSDLGWKNHYDKTGNIEKEEGLDADYLEGGMFYDNGDIVALEALFLNPSDSFATYENCMVVGVRLSYSQTLNGQDDAEDVVVVPNGSIVINDEIAIGESTREDIHNALGADWGETFFENADYKEMPTVMYYFGEEADEDNVFFATYKDDIFYEFNFTKKDE